MKRIDLWSSGGGVQSTAVAVLILQGKLPKPDLAVIADTEREKQSTWDYLEQYTAPALEAFGVHIYRISKDDYDAPDLYSGKDSDSILIPMFTRQSGSLGKLPTYCSTEWKQRVVRRFADEQFPDSQFRVWMGMSRDEERRIKPVSGKWQTWYPLFEMLIRRGDCIRLVNDYGWPVPPQSSCWMCPNRRAEQWKSMSVDNPGEFRKAVQLEKSVRLDDPDAYFHEWGIPLEEAVLVQLPKDGNLFDAERCDSGYCFV